MRRRVPYDGVERRYRDGDADRAEGLAAVAEVLQLQEPPPAGGLRYDLSFYSGGIGVLDKLAIALPATDAMWRQIVTGLGANAPEALANAADRRDADDFRWLIRCDEPVDVRTAASRFVDRERAAFQPPCTTSDELLFVPQSTVNDWSVIWRTSDTISFSSFSQG